MNVFVSVSKTRVLSAETTETKTGNFHPQSTASHTSIISSTATHGVQNWSPSKESSSNKAKGMDTISAKLELNIC